MEVENRTKEGCAESAGISANGAAENMKIGLLDTLSYCTLFCLSFPTYSASKVSLNNASREQSKLAPFPVVYQQPPSQLWHSRSRS